MEYRGACWLASALLALAVPAFGAEHSSGGSHGGGGHFSGAAHVGGGNRGGGAHFGGAAPRSANGHFAVPTTRANARMEFASPGTRTGNLARSYASVSRAPVGAGAYARGGQGYAARAAGGYWRGGHWVSGGYWRGGYWRGGYWPAVSYGAGFAWFLPVLPAVYATYWYDSVPYYYADDAYYTWDAGADGYVATPPPPTQDASDSNAASADTAAPPTGADTGADAQNAYADNGAAPSAPPPSSDHLYVYPSSGQTDQQQTADRAECQQWATAQTQTSGGGNDSPDYLRAESACLEGRGYTVR